jgi:hypothetical protein
MGFVQFLARKYNLPDGTQFTPDGEIVLKAKEANG